jgi:hypothetical protein
VKVPTVEGAVMLKVPKGSSSGKVLRLKGRGFHKKRRHARRPARHADGRSAGRRRGAEASSSKGWKATRAQPARRMGV